MAYNLKTGDRVRLTSEGVKKFPDYKDMIGKIISPFTEEETFVVDWPDNGQRVFSSYWLDFVKTDIDPR